MFGRNSLKDEIGEPPGSSPSAIALCCAIIEDAEVARAFDIEPRGAVELLCTVVMGAPSFARGSAPPPSELTSLIA